jgi:hypothetical protein
MKLSKLIPLLALPTVDLMAHYPLRDDFTTGLAAGSVDNTAAEPGPGRRDVTDSGSKLSLENGYLKIAEGAGAWNDPVLGYDESLARGAGAMYTLLRPHLTTYIAGAWLNAAKQPAAPGTNGYGFRFTADTPARANLGILGGPATVIPYGIYPRCNVDHLVAVIPRPTAGAIVLVAAPHLAAYPAARILWVSAAGSGTPLYPAIAGYTAGDGGFIRAKTLRITTDLPSNWLTQWGLAADYDTFTRLDGALGNSEGAGAAWTNLRGACQISANQIKPATKDAGNYTVSVIETGQADGWFEIDYTLPASAGFFGLVFRAVDSQNYFAFIHRKSNNTVRLYKWVSNVQTDIASNALTLGAGTTHRLRVHTFGSRIICFVDDVQYINISDADLQTATRAGVISYNELTALGDNFAVWPLTVTLPLSLRSPVIPPSGGLSLQVDEFTGEDATALEEHNPLWTIAAGTWEINSNQARQTAAGAVGHAVMDTGSPDHEAACTITMPGATPVTDDWYPGVYVRYTDLSNFVHARFLYQSNSPEIELWENVGGTTAFITAVNLGPGNLAAGSTRTLRVAIRGQEIAVYLDNVLRAQGVTNLTTGNKAGIGTMAACEGQPTYDAWEIKTT